MVVSFQGCVVVTPAVSAVWSSIPLSSTMHTFRAPSTRTSEYNNLAFWINDWMDRQSQSHYCVQRLAGWERISRVSLTVSSFILCTNTFKNMLWVENVTPWKKRLSDSMYLCFYNSLHQDAEAKRSMCGHFIQNSHFPVCPVEVICMMSQCAKCARLPACTHMGKNMETKLQQ